MKQRESPRGKASSLLLGLMILLWTMFIWSNSAKPAVESAGQSLQILVWIKDIILVFGFDEELLHTLVRKAAHVVEFTVLGGLWMAFAGQKWNADWKFACLLPLTASHMTAVIDETIQLYFDGRAGMIQDLWVDLIGVILGMILAGLAFALKKANRR